MYKQLTYLRMYDDRTTVRRTSVELPRTSFVVGGSLYTELFIVTQVTVTAGQNSLPSLSKGQEFTEVGRPRTDTESGQIPVGSAHHLTHSEPVQSRWRVVVPRYPLQVCHFIVSGFYTYPNVCPLRGSGIL